MKNVLVIVTILGIVAFLDTPFSMSGHRVDFDTLVPAMAEVEEEDLSLVPTLEMQLIKKEVIDGHVIETYQEIEVTKDENGDVISSVPTSKYEYLRYFISKP
ncbi:hypothetical protein JOC85_002164 [Bacillus mesophilus]|uniref:Uncharacterized protein n=1 Tax=Bacillus mesophilus TaxID=1808955 RepID=A0A6M0Q6S7_9BACI|nr:hypothetical protein [Bacillus mesophilus]MBM7661361.1 hypothetical protein [Bacillus mesophilus]NEY72034.1 hypothetical protein [Bacillus mesophilus]